jgi:hypothetical protein
MVAADHPEVVEHYRAAHTIAGRRQDQTTEDQRRAFMHYRALFAALLDDGGRGRHAASKDIDLTARDRSDAEPRQDQRRDGRSSRAAEQDV